MRKKSVQQSQFSHLTSDLLANVHAQFQSLSTLHNESNPYEVWQSASLTLPHHPTNEFCLQTAFIQIVHIFLLRACEASGILSRHPHNSQEKASTLLPSIQRTLEILKTLCPQLNTPFARSFDWFIPDAQTLLAIYDLLDGYDFQNLQSDLLGKLYNQHFIAAQNRSEQGQFYTPLSIVNYMLDTLELPTSAANGYKKPLSFLNATIADLSCGSGSFLVVAAARKRALLQHLLANGEMSRADALRTLTGSIVGFDLNPFACHLATLNVLLQCLPLLVDEQGNVCSDSVHLHEYCADVLEPGIIERLGFEHFDFLTGNPPYVSAHESAAQLSYRHKLWQSGQYHLLRQKWDLFVPFFERNLQLLQPGSGRLSLIVSSGIETEGYAEKLRGALCTDYCLLQIDFFPGQRVFQDAAIESTIVTVQRSQPERDHLVSRRKHLRSDSISFESLPSLSQLTTPSAHLFRWRYNPSLAASILEGTLPLCALVYIGTGLEAQSSERTETLIAGERHKHFTLYDVFVLPGEGGARPQDYPDDGVVGNDIDRYYLRRTRWVAYEKFVSAMRGPRHLALFRAPEKLLLGETSGGYYDTAGLFANHSVQLVVPWHALAHAGAIDETGIARVLQKSRHICGRSDLVALSEQFDLRYLLAIINSRFMRDYLATNMHKGTRKSRIYPDVWKRMPVKMLPLERQREIGALVAKVQEMYRQGMDEEKLDNIQRLLEKIELSVLELY